MKLRTFLESVYNTVKDVEKWYDTQKSSLYSQTDERVKFDYVAPGVFDATTNGYIYIRHDLPFKLRKVKGYLNAKYITTLNNFPDEINGALIIADCDRLTSLAGLPKTVHGNLCFFQVDYRPRLRCLLSNIGGNIDDNIFYAGRARGNRELLFKILNKYKNAGRAGIIPCQDELIEAGFTKEAKL